MEKIFWILWNPQGYSPPTYRFASYEDAAKRAEEMQRKIGNGTMYVMQAVQSVTVSQKVKWQGLKENQNIG